MRETLYSFKESDRSTRLLLFIFVLEMHNSCKLWIPLPIISKKSVPRSLSLKLREIIWGFWIKRLEMLLITFGSLIQLLCTFIIEIRECFDSVIASIIAYNPEFPSLFLFLLLSLFPKSILTKEIWFISKFFTKIFSEAPIISLLDNLSEINEELSLI